MAAWLLRMRDGRDSEEFSVTEEFLALMLGVARLSAAFTGEEFVDDGLLRYCGGVVTITNGPGLEAVACECYRLMCEEDVRLNALMRVGEMWRQ